MTRMGDVSCVFLNLFSNTANTPVERPTRESNLSCSVGSQGRGGAACTTWTWRAVLCWDGVRWRRGCEREREGLKVMGKLGELVLKTHSICQTSWEGWIAVGNPHVLWGGTTAGFQTGM